MSDAFPAGWLPAPAILRETTFLDHYRRAHPDPELRAGVVKRVRKSHWISQSGFRSFQAGRIPSIDHFALHDPVKSFGEISNRIGRQSNTTLDRGLFVPDS
jgi:hypothetical protein